MGEIIIRRRTLTPEEQAVRIRERMERELPKKIVKRKGVSETKSYRKDDWLKKEGRCLNCMLVVEEGTVHIPQYKSKRHVIGDKTVNGKKEEVYIDKKEFDHCAVVQTLFGQPEQKKKKKKVSHPAEELRKFKEVKLDAF